MGKQPFRILAGPVGREKPEGRRPATRAFNYEGLQTTGTQVNSRKEGKVTGDRVRPYGSRRAAGGKWV